jgi:hypothetical protein
MRADPRSRAFLELVGEHAGEHSLVSDATFEVIHKARDHDARRSATAR